MAAVRLIDRLKAIGTQKVPLDLFMLEAELKCAVCLEICASDEANSLPIRPKTGCACNLVICRGCWKSHTHQLAVSNGAGGHAVFRCFNCRKEVKWTNRIGMPNKTMATVGATLIGNSTAFRDSISLATQLAIDESMRRQAATAPLSRLIASASESSSAPSSSTAIQPPSAVLTVPVPVVNIAFRKKHNQGQQTMVPTMPDSIILQCRADMTAWEARYVLATWLLYLNKEWWPCVHTHAVDGYFPNMHNWPDAPWSTSDKELMSAHYRLNVGGAQGNHLKLTVQQKGQADRVWKENMTAADVHRLLWQRSGDVLVAYEIISPHPCFEVMSPPEKKIGLPALGPPGSVGFKHASKTGPDAYSKYGTQVLPVMPRMASDAEKGKGQYSANLPPSCAQAPPFPAHLDVQRLKPIKPKGTGKGAGASTPAMSTAGSTDVGGASPSGFSAAGAGAGAGGPTMKRSKLQRAEGAAGATVREGVGAPMQLAPIPVPAVNPSSSAPASDRANTLPQLSQLMQAPAHGDSRRFSPRAAAAGRLPLPSLIASTSPPPVGTTDTFPAPPPVSKAAFAGVTSGNTAEAAPSLHTSFRMRLPTASEGGSATTGPHNTVARDQAPGGMDATVTGPSTASTVPDVAPASSGAGGGALSTASQSTLAEGKKRKLKVDVDDIAVHAATASSTSEHAVRRVAKRSHLSDAASSFASTGASARGAPASSRSQTSARYGQPATAAGYSRRAKGRDAPWKKAISAPLPDWGSPLSPAASGFVCEVFDVDTWRIVLQYLTTLVSSSSGFDRRVDMDLPSAGQPTVHPVLYVPLLVFRDVNVNGPNGGDLKELLGAAKSEADKHQRERKFIADHEQISVTHGVPQPRWALFLGPGKQVCFGLDAYRQIGGSSIEDGVLYHGHRVCALVPLLRGDVQAVKGDAATRTVHIMLSQSGLQGVMYQFEGAMSRADGYSSLRLLPEHAREQRRAAKTWAESNREDMIYPTLSSLGSARASQSGSLSGHNSAGGSLLPELISSPAAASGDRQSTSTAAQATGPRMLGGGSSSGAVSTRDSMQKEEGGHGEDRAVEAAMPRKTFGQRGKYRGARLANLVRLGEKRRSFDASEGKDGTAAGQPALEPTHRAAGALQRLPAMLATHTHQTPEEENRGSDEEEEEDDQEEEPMGYKMMSWDDDDEELIPNRPVMKRHASAKTSKPALSAPLASRISLGKSQPPASAAPALSPPLASSQSRPRPPTTSGVSAGSSSAAAAAAAVGVGTARSGGSGAGGSSLPSSSSKKRKSIDSAALPLLISKEEIMDSYEGSKRRVEQEARGMSTTIFGRQLVQTKPDHERVQAPAVRDKSKTHTEATKLKKRLKLRAAKALQARSASPAPSSSVSAATAAAPYLSAAPAAASADGASLTLGSEAAMATTARPLMLAAGSASKEHGNVGSPGDKSMPSSLLGKRAAAEAGLSPDEGSSRKVGPTGVQAESVGEGKEKERDTPSGTGLPASTAKKVPYMASSSSQGTSRVINHTWQSPAPAPAPAHGLGKVQIAMPAPRSLPAPQRSPPDPLRSSAAAPVLLASQATGASGGAGVAPTPAPAPASLPAAGGNMGASAGAGFLSLADARKSRYAGTTHCGQHSAPCGADVYNCLDPTLGYGWCERCGPVPKGELSPCATAYQPSGSTADDDVIDID